MRFFLSKSPRNSLKYFFNHIIFYSFSFEFLLIIINFLLNKFSLIKTSSKTPFLINTASNLLHNSMPPLHRKRSPSPQGEAFRLPLRGAVGIAVCGVAFLRPMIATTNIYYLLSIFVYSLLCTIDLYAGLIILPQPITSSSLCAHQPTILEIAKSGVYISVGMPSIL